MRSGTWIWGLTLIVALATGAARSDELLGKRRGDKPKSDVGSGGSSQVNTKSPQKGEAKPTRVKYPDPPVRVESNRPSGTSSRILSSRPKQGRSGVVQYGTKSNLFDGRRSQAPEKINSYPFDHETRRQARQEEKVRVRPSVKLRSGYYHYSNRWRDDWFWYPYYRFSFDYVTSVPSFWYYYPNLPAYISMNRVVFLNSWPGYPAMSSYPWTYFDNYQYGSINYDLDVAVRDLVRMFERRDRRALDDLVPRNENIIVRNENDSPYMLRSDDFYDMMLDGIESTQTRSYHIIGVHYGRGYAQVNARHEFDDPWGRRNYVYHTYILKQARRGYTIAEFRTSYYQ